jgi:hypothetical protein
LQRGLLVVGERLLTVRQLRRSGQPLERPDPEFVTAMTRSADLLREGRELDGSTPSPPARTGWTPTPCWIRPDGCVV